MKFIELHDERSTLLVNVNAIGIIETATITTTPNRSRISTYVYIHGIGHYFIETVKEILQKIAEAERSETGSMDDWKRKLTNSSVGKEENSYA